MDQKLTDLDELTDVADGDFHYVVDVSDTSESPEGTGKKAQQQNITAKLEALKVRLVADGSITAGQAVEFLEGKLKTGGGDNLTQAAETTASTDNGVQLTACVLSETSFAIAYVSPTVTLKCVIGTISGTTITFGTEVTADATTSCFNPSIIALSATKIAIAYGITGAGKAILATISGTVPTFGSSVTFKSATLLFFRAAALSSSLFAVTFSDSGNTLTQIIAATVSGTVPTFGSALTIVSRTSSALGVVKMSSTATVGFCRINSTTDCLYFVVTYVSSTLTLLLTNYAPPVDGSFLSIDKLNSNTLVQPFRGTDTYGYIRLINFNGANLKISQDILVTAKPAEYSAIAAIDENRAMVSFTHSDTSNTIAYLLEIQNETAIVKSSVTVTATVSTYNFLVCPRSDKVINVYELSSDIKSRLTQISKFMGLAAESVADTATASAVVRGVSSAHSGLTTGALYYTDLSGAVSTDSTGRFLGIAISSTKILLENRLDRATASRSDLIDAIPVAYTPTFTGFGTVSVFDAKSWRIGAELFFEITFTVGTPTATEARISLGYKGVNNAVTSASTYPTLQYCGTAVQSVDSASYPVLIEAGKTYVTFGLQNPGVSAGLLKKNGNAVSPNAPQVFSFKGSVRISGW